MVVVRRFDEWNLQTFWQRLAGVCPQGVPKTLTQSSNRCEFQIHEFYNSKFFFHWIHVIEKSMNHEESGVFFNRDVFFSHCQLEDFECFMSTLDVNFVAFPPRNRCYVFILDLLFQAVCMYRTCHRGEVFGSWYLTPLSASLHSRFTPPVFIIIL